MTFIAARRRGGTASGKPSAGQRDVAAAGGCLDALRHRDVPQQGVVGGGGQLHVVAVVAVRQLDREVVVDVLSLSGLGAVRAADCR